MLLKLKSLFCLLQAALMAISHFSVYDSNFKRWVDRAALSVTGVEHFSFEPIEAGQLPVTPAEKARDNTQKQRERTHEQTHSLHSPASCSCNRR